MFTLQLVLEIESGKFRGVFDAGKRYEIRGSDTIKEWRQRTE